MTQAVHLEDEPMQFDAAYDQDETCDDGDEQDAGEPEVGQFSLLGLTCVASIWLLLD